ncbi:MAG: hypothetical protein INQ03_22715 [Candidatus Heimdallarchaeota archaeon]|nr:hypothetical protein [Candidatus Heimdallarchaeota archaeon]
MTPEKDTSGFIEENQTVIEIMTYISEDDHLILKDTSRVIVTNNVLGDLLKAQMEYIEKKKKKSLESRYNTKLQFDFYLPNNQHQPLRKDISIEDIQDELNKTGKKLFIIGYSRM